MDFTSQYKNPWPAIFLAVLLRSLGNPLGLTTAETKRWNSPTGTSGHRSPAGLWKLFLIGREDHIPAAGGSYPCALDELVAAVNARTQQTMQMRDHNKEDHSM